MLITHIKTLQTIIASYDSNNINGYDLYDHITYQIDINCYGLDIIYNMPCINDNPRAFWAWVHSVQKADTNVVIASATFADVWPIS